MGSHAAASLAALALTEKPLRALERVELFAAGAWATRMASSHSHQSPGWRIPAWLITQLRAPPLSHVVPNLFAKRTHGRSLHLRPLGSGPVGGIWAILARTQGRVSTRPGAAFFFGPLPLTTTTPAQL